MKARFLALAITLAAFLLAGCGEEENSVKQGGETVDIEEVEQTGESQGETEPAEESREEPEPTGSQKETEPAGNQEETTAVEPTTASVEEAMPVTVPAETVPVVPPPQPEPAATGISIAQTAVPNPASVGQPLRPYPETAIACGCS